MCLLSLSSADHPSRPKKSAKAAYMEEVKLGKSSKVRLPGKTSAPHARAKKIVEVDPIEISDSDDHLARR